jgi:hypothetical protein
VDEPGPVTRALRGIVGAAVDDRGLAEQICAACVTGLEIDGAAISLLAQSPARVVLWATDTTAELLEDLQFALNEGPGMEAAAIGSPVLVADLSQPGEASRWPMFADAVTERASASALFALPLQWGAVKLGVLDLYRLRPGGLSQVQRGDLLAAADIAAVLLLELRTGSGADGWLDPAVSHRAEIHQATGMVLAQLGVSATEALARMRAYAFAEQRSLGEIAGDVVARRLRFSRDMD